jgi:hypothetical protein
MSARGHSLPVDHALTSRDVRNCSKAELSCFRPRGRAVPMAARYGHLSQRVVEARVEKDRVALARLATKRERPRERHNARETHPGLSSIPRGSSASRCRSQCLMVRPSKRRTPRHRHHLPGIKNSQSESYAEIDSDGLRTRLRSWCTSLLFCTSKSVQHRRGSRPGQAWHRLDLLDALKRPAQVANRPLQ